MASVLRFSKFPSDRTPDRHWAAQASDRDCPRSAPTCSPANPRGSARSRARLDRRTFREFPAHVGVKLNVERLTCSQRRSSSFAKSSGGMSYFERHSAPVSLNPSSREPRLESSTKRAKSLRWDLEVSCQPIHASRSSFAILARRHQARDVFDVEAFVFSGRAPLRLAVDAFHARSISVSSALCCGSPGVGITSEVLSRCILRARSGGS